MLWHQSLKSIHYRTLIIKKKKTNFRVKTWGDKRHVKPQSQNMGRIHPPIPPGFTPLPAEIHPRQFSYKSNANWIVFGGPFSVFNYLSNHYEAPMAYNGIVHKH